jgi:protein TonB
MEPKKNPAKDVHRYSKQYFLIGLIISCSIAIMAFEWRSEVKEVKKTEPIHDNEFVYYQIPVTAIEDLPKPEKPRPSKIFDITKVESTKEESTPSDDLSIIETFTDTPGLIEIELPVEPKPDSLFVWAEKMPEPLGGYSGFYKLLTKNMKYPSLAKRRGTEGKVMVEFVVDKTGEPTNMKVLNGIGNGCDEEAMRVLKLAKWEPGKQRGKFVLVKMILSVYFKLE